MQTTCDSGNKSIATTLVNIFLKDLLFLYFSLHKDGKVSLYEGTERDGLVNTVLVWAFLSANGKSGIYRIDGKFNTTQYITVLNAMLAKLPNVQDSIPYDFVHDSNPVNKSKAIQNWFLTKTQLKLLPWPPAFGDVNPMEQLWVDLEKSLNSDLPLKPYSNIDDLWLQIHLNFKVRTKPMFNRCKLTDMIPNKLKMVIEKEGCSID